MFRILIKTTLLFVLLYAVLISILLKYFLSDLVFVKVKEQSTHETFRHSVKLQGNEVVVREYRAESEVACALYFPGQGGGVSEYEDGIFKFALARNISIYAISLPGYEGALGVSRYESVFDVVKKAVDYIDSNTSCKISKSVFIGRSLGAMIALQIATEVRPTGLLLDSTATSLSAVVVNKMKKSIFLKPATMLPVGLLMQFNPKMEDVMTVLGSTPIIIFQGDKDTLTPLKDIEAFSKSYGNIELIQVKSGTHSNTHMAAGVLYFEKLEQLLKSNR